MLTCHLLLCVPASHPSPGGGGLPTHHPLTPRASRVRSRGWVHRDVKPGNLLRARAAGPRSPTSATPALLGAADAANPGANGSGAAAAAHPGAQWKLADFGNACRVPLTTAGGPAGPPLSAALGQQRRQPAESGGWWGGGGGGGGGSGALAVMQTLAYAPPEDLLGLLPPPGGVVGPAATRLGGGGGDAAEVGSSGRRLGREAAAAWAHPANDVWSAACVVYEALSGACVRACVRARAYVLEATHLMTSGALQAGPCKRDKRGPESQLLPGRSDDVCRAGLMGSTAAGDTQRQSSGKPEAASRAGSYARACSSGSSGAGDGANLTCRGMLPLVVAAGRKLLDAARCRQLLSLHQAAGSVPPGGAAGAGGGGPPQPRRTWGRGAGGAPPLSCAPAPASGLDFSLAGGGGGGGGGRRGAVLLLHTSSTPEMATQVAAVQRLGGVWAAGQLAVGGTADAGRQQGWGGWHDDDGWARLAAVWWQRAAAGWAQQEARWAAPRPLALASLVGQGGWGAAATGGGGTEGGGGGRKESGGCLPVEALEEEDLHLWHMVHVLWPVDAQVRLITCLECASSCGHLVQPALSHPQVGHKATCARSVCFDAALPRVRVALAQLLRRATLEPAVACLDPEGGSRLDHHPSAACVLLDARRAATAAATATRPGPAAGDAAPRGAPTPAARPQPWGAPPSWLPWAGRGGSAEAPRDREEGAARRHQGGSGSSSSSRVAAAAALLPLRERLRLECPHLGEAQAEEALAFLGPMLAYAPEARPTAAQALAHPFVAGTGRAD